jgi:hypothetical protein
MLLPLIYDLMLEIIIIIIIFFRLTLLAYRINQHCRFLNPQTWDLF